MLVSPMIRRRLPIIRHQPSVPVRQLHQFIPSAIQSLKFLLQRSSDNEERNDSLEQQPKHVSLHILPSPMFLAKFPSLFRNSSGEMIVPFPWVTGLGRTGEE